MSFNFVFQSILDFFALYWWIIVPIIFLPLYSSTALFVTHEKRKRENKWVILDIKISRETKKTPQAMEQILETMNGWGTLPSRKPTEWASLELISIGGEIHFMIRILEKYKNLLESTFFSFYQDVDIKEVDDYMDHVPSNTAQLYARDLNVWGTELILGKEGAYPIKSYKEFTSGGEGKEFDPMSVFTEIMGRLLPDEFLGVQMILMPISTKSVREKYKPLLEKLKAKPKEGETLDTTTLKLTLGTDAKKVKVVEENLSKPFFNTLIRAIYVAPRSSFREKYAKQGIVSSFNQYASPDLNSFKKNSQTEIGDVLPNPDKLFALFPKSRDEARKERILHTYRHRDVPPVSAMGKLISSMFFHTNNASRFVELSTESLATVFHLPTTVVLTAPFMQRVESRKVGPPQGLAIFGGNEDLEIFET
ncbi:MAG: hypothetical protein LiPW15_136 [Parcubacteria group bacterium LiPW_15]|nr:MAG: hypothetical protein LiPW15_136 [Parcubacteria group bacterium LiPW_15]